MTRVSLRVCLLTLLWTSACGQQQEVTYRLREELEAGTFVGNVARDSLMYSQFSQAESLKLQYKIPPTTSKFFIDSKTSTVRTTQAIDRETECVDNFQPEADCSISFDVSVYRLNADESFNLLRIVKVKVVIEDINDNAPTFPANQTTLDIPENVEVNQVLRISAAVDRDSSKNNTVQMYSLEGGGDVFGLQVMANSAGMISDLGIVVKKALDRERRSSYQLKVIAEDGGFPRRSGTVNISVRVTDVNDNVPQFRKNAFEVTIPEDRTVGSTVLTLQAEDPDEGENGRLSFSFSSMTSTKVTEYFSVAITTGDIYLVKRLDYEKDKSFRFTVVVKDNGAPAKSSQASVHVIVQDVNDNAPQIDVTLPSAYIKESLNLGSYIAHISLSDQDSSENSEITCNVANEHFMLQRFPNSNSIYTVILRTHLDYEKSRMELVNISCHDGGVPPLYNSSVFTIFVQDINDNAPVFTRSRYQVTLNEDNNSGQYVTQVQAVDPDEGDNGNVTYSLSFNPEDKFQIDPVSGIIKVLAVLDHETQTKYELEVTARDKGAIPNSSSVIVVVYVGDINDNPPHFQRPFYEMRVQENLPRSTFCGTVLANDPDTDLDNQLRYQFDRNFSFADLFTIDRLSGSIHTLKPLDRERRDSYTFEVMVFDESEPSFYDVTRVSILVGDVNDNKPYITFPTESNNTFQLGFTHPPSVPFLTIECQDADVGENGTVHFIILLGNDKGLFFINSISGELLVAKRMGVHDVGSVTLVILARDGGPVPLESSSEIHIQILMVNGTTSFLQEEESRANMAIVITLICITAIMALAVVVTICIIRKIDKDRKQPHGKVKAEVDQAYKHKVIPHTPAASPLRGSYDNEVQKLKRQIRRDMSLTEDEESGGGVDCSGLSSKSSFSTFKNTASDVDEMHLSNSMSPGEVSIKKINYVDKGVEIERLKGTIAPARQQASSSSSPTRFGRQSQWSATQTTSYPTSVITCPVEDSASHSSGSTSDSGRGGSSEEGDSLGQQSTAAAVVVAYGDRDHTHTPVAAYSSPTRLVTFGSPKSALATPASSHHPHNDSNSQHYPQSSPTSSETAKKRLWAETSRASSQGNSSLSARLSSDSPLQILAMSETNQNSSYRPNISFSDDSVTANTTVGTQPNTTHLANHAGIHFSDSSSDNSHRLFPSAYSNPRRNSQDHYFQKPDLSLTSTYRQAASPKQHLSDSHYSGMTGNISRIPESDSPVRHGMFVEEASLMSDTGSTVAQRSPAKTTANGRNFRNDLSQGNSSVSYPLGSVRTRALSPRQASDQTHNSSSGQRYSLDDVNLVLDRGSVVSQQRDDDDNTTTSGSYTINADDLCQEIDHLFFKDIVV